jgi:hypothetical protein
MSKELNYAEIIEKIEVLDKWLLLKLANDATSQKDRYLRNSIAKSITLLKSINSEYSRQSYNEGWILFRSLIDRLVYIYYLKDNNKFEEFEEWSFIKFFEHQNKARADERFRRVLNDKNFAISKDDSNRYNNLKKKNIKWEKPDPMIILNSKGLDFLYKFGYDYSSRQAHPMISDGECEFYFLTGLEPNPYKAFDNDILIKNAILVTTMIQQDILNYLSFGFRAIIYSFLEQIRNQINGIETELDFTFFKILKLIEANVSLFEKTD